MIDEEAGGIVRETRALMEEYNKVDVQVVVEPGTLAQALVAVAGGAVNPIPSTTFDNYRERPLRLRGTAALTSLDALIHHINRFKDMQSVVFADDSRTAPSLTAVYDYHEPSKGDAAGSDIARHMLHRSHFAFPLSDEWQAWVKANDQKMSMVEFAEFLDERVIDVLHLIPGEDEISEDLQKYIDTAGGDTSIATPHKLVELSRGLQVNESSVVREVNRLQSGEGQILFQVDHTDANGEPLKVPGLFLIGIPVFRNGPFYRLAARLRYRKTPGGIVFWYDLWRVDRTFDHAVSEACERVRVETSLPVLLGKPEA